MLKFLAEELSLRLVANNIIDNEDRKYYTYGIELILNDFIIFIMIAVIAIATESVLLSIVFSGCFCVLRAYTGGYHSRTYSGCIITAISNYLAMLLLIICLDDWRFITGNILLVFSIPYIWINAPISHNNSPIKSEGRKKYKRISRIILTLMMGFYIFSAAFLSEEITFSIAWSVFATSILMLLAVILQKRRLK